MSLWASSSHNISLGEIIKSLEAVEAVAPGAASRNPRLGLRNAIKFLKSSGKSDLEGFVRTLESQNRASPPKRKTPTKPREETIAKHIRNLERARTNNAAFASAMSELREDNKVRLLELNKIAEQYSNAKQNFRSKAKGYGVLEQVFDHRWKLANR